MGEGSGGAATAVLIAGPTASGKSALASSIACARGGIVINADAMQVYRELCILTARPSAADEAAAPHRLYGHVAAAERYSVGRWLADAAAALAEARAAGRLPVFVGGTGLYFAALTEGLADLPPIPAAVRAAVAARLAAEGPAALHAALAARDPAGAAMLAPADRTRIARALEVIEATGHPLAAWQRRAPPPLIDLATAERVLVLPDRAELYRRIDRRVEAMLAAGALAEAERIGRLRLDPALPAMKAIGVRELLDVLAGRAEPAEAAARIKTASRQYAKRQMTWLRQRMAGWTIADPAEV
jgi:tRNA dimethylallyltransferase